MALFACAAKLGSETYGARHARAKPSVVQWVLTVKETVVIKPNRLNIVAQDLSNSLPVPFLSCCTPLSPRTGGVHYEKKRDVAQHLHFTYTHARQA